ncbi:protein PML-like isoform X2 [Notechis scutatus]|uniref:Protein PML-like isoform X2 n=1 Tax=Notechis scutatus TaxID=8663 RepID=A0A6J1VC52_9SAUR|nr:protein PML-like isoform X2 [Notechis scutatus]
MAEASGFQEMKEEFQFLLCDSCHAEVLNPTLLPCLHNLCSQCREENKPIGVCVICGTPHSHSAEIPQNPDNVFFANLQFKFSLYQKVTGNQRLACENCENEAEFWCSTCKEFLCTLCFRSHQRYLKKENHEARSLKDFQAESYREFFSTVRKNNTMFCSKVGHNTQMLSLYCKQCNQSMCTICALLDGEHMGQHCDISQEIQCRQDELQNMSAELKEKKNAYDKSFSSHEELVRKMVQLRNETQELIQRKIEEMIRMLQEKGEGYLAEVEALHNHQVQEVEEKLQEMDGVRQRITSSQRMVEKMHLYASGQEVLEIHPFLRQSMMELRRKQPPTAEGIKVKNFVETKSQLQNLLERVTNKKGHFPDMSVAPPPPASSPVGNGYLAVASRVLTTPGRVPSQSSSPEKNALQSQQPPGILPVPAKPQTPKPQKNFSGSPSSKRQYVEETTKTEGHLKMFKMEPLNEEEWNDSTSMRNEPGTSYGSTGVSYITGNQEGLRETLDDTLIATDYSSDLEEDSSMNISSEEESTDDDDDDDEIGASNLSLDINPISPVGQKSPMRYPLDKPENASSQFIFFLFKSLPGNSLHLVVLGDKDTVFNVTISYQENSRERVSVFGLDELLQYLSILQVPILVGYKLWSMDIPALLNALQEINKEQQFEGSILGFLDVLPLIREKIPDISKNTLKNVDKKYLCGTLDHTNMSNCVRYLMELCTRYEINKEFLRLQLIPCSSLRCYSSLQPLLRERVLSMPSVQTLALHNISLDTLQCTYLSDPEEGLKKLCRRLNANLRIGEKKIQRLSKIRTYFQHLPSSSQGSSLPEIP